MSSNLKVNTILPSTGNTVAISGIASVTSSISIASSCTATTFYGDGSNLTGVSGVTINGNVDNRLVTATGTTGTINGEANLTFDGSTLNNTNGGANFTKSANNYILVGSTNASGASLVLDGDSNGDGSGTDYAFLTHNTDGDLDIVVDNPANAGNIKFFTNSTTERLRITSGGQVCIGTNTATRALTIKDPGQIHVESTSTGNWVGMSIKGSSGTNNYNAYFGMLDSNGNFFIDNGSNGDDFVITQTGQITKPNHCCFEVKLNGDQAFNSASRFKINFNYVANQQGTSFDTSNNRFTAPVTGYYQFNVGVYSYYSTYMEIDGRCNGASTGAKTYRPTTRYSDGTDRNPGASMMASWIVKLSTNDYYEIYCYVVSSSGTRNIYSDINRTPTWWSGYLVC